MRPAKGVDIADVVASQRGRHTGAVWCPGPIILPLAERLDVPLMYDRRQKCWLVNLKRFGELLAGLETDGHRVNYRTALW